MTDIRHFRKILSKTAIASLPLLSMGLAIAPSATAFESSSPSQPLLVAASIVNSAQVNSTQVNSAQVNSAQVNSTQVNSAQVNSAQRDSQSLPLAVVLRLSERRVNVYRGEMLVASYEVAVGREGWNTPTGEFSIFQKQVDPAWEHPFTDVVVPPGPDNPLGSRWIGFWSDGVNSIGFHGTPDESLIGSAVSHGCVRMRNEDVLALYEQVSLNTPVTVLP